jgi:hypothetical protein
MIYSPGVTSQSVDVLIVDDSGVPVTLLTSSDFPEVTWSRAGANGDNVLSLSDLPLITSPWDGTTDCGLIERGNGVYRLDLPNTVFAAAGKVRFRAEETDKHLILEIIEVSLAFGLMEADQYTDTGVNPWAVVYMVRGSGGIGVGTELLRRRLYSVAGAPLTSADTIVGQAKQ